MKTADAVTIVIGVGVVGAALWLVSRGVDATNAGGAIAGQRTNTGILAQLAALLSAKPKPARSEMYSASNPNGWVMLPQGDWTRTTPEGVEIIYQDDFLGFGGGV